MDNASDSQPRAYEGRVLIIGDGWARMRRWGDFGWNGGERKVPGSKLAVAEGSGELEEVGLLEEGGEGGLHLLFGGLGGE